MSTSCFEILLSILSKNQNNKSALSEIFKMCWMSMQEHVVDEKKVVAIIRLDYRTCSRLLSDKSGLEKSRHEQQTTLRQPRACSRCICVGAAASSASRYAGHWGVLKRIRKTRCSSTWCSSV